MNSLMIYPLSFLLAILWYEPTQDGGRRVLPFALVTTFDLLALFIFLSQRQIGHWHDIDGTEVAMRGPGTVRWGIGVVQPVSEG